MITFTDLSDEDAPKIEFPCLYPIKIIGFAESDFQATVVEIVERHTGKITAELIKVRQSSQQQYLSVTITIAATGKDQLENIFSDLKRVDSVKLVL
jgi:putative lipoic acid-binding regulatory protein